MFYLKRIGSFTDIDSIYSYNSALNGGYLYLDN